MNDEIPPYILAMAKAPKKKIWEFPHEEFSLPDIIWGFCMGIITSTIIFLSFVR